MTSEWWKAYEEHRVGKLDDGGVEKKPKVEMEVEEVEVEEGEVKKAKRKVEEDKWKKVTGNLNMKQFWKLPQT